MSSTHHTRTDRGRFLRWGRGVLGLLLLVHTRNSLAREDAGLLAAGLLVDFLVHRVRGVLGRRHEEVGGLQRHGVNVDSGGVGDRPVYQRIKGRKCKQVRWRTERVTICARD